jgi:hypothetical protein
MGRRLQQRTNFHERGFLLDNEDEVDGINSMTRVPTTAAHMPEQA